MRLAARLLMDAWRKGAMRSWKMINGARWGGQIEKLKIDWRQEEA